MNDYIQMLFRVPIELRDWLKNRAADEMCSVAALLRRLAINYMAQVDRKAYNKFLGKEIRR